MREIGWDKRRKTHSRERNAFGDGRIRTKAAKGLLLIKFSVNVAKMNTTEYTHTHTQIYIYIYISIKYIRIIIKYIQALPSAEYWGGIYGV